MAKTVGKIVGFILGDACGLEYGVPQNIGWIDTIEVEFILSKKGWPNC